MKAHKELETVQKTLKAPKGQYNAFGKYNYRSCEDIVEAVKEVMPSGSTLTLSDEIIEVAGRVYVKATASFNFEGESVSVSACAREAETKKGMDEAQVTGAASSYARKYALNGLFAIDDTKDADATEKHGKTEESQRVGETLSMKPDRMQQEQFHTSALTIINACATLEKLGEVWKKNVKAWSRLDEDLFADITQAKDQAKEELEGKL